MLNFGRLIVVVVVGLVAAAASAQTSSNPRRTFVDVPVAPDWDDAYSGSTRVPGATWGSGFAFGFDSGRSGVEFDVGVPRWHVKDRAPQRFQYVGPSRQWEQQGHFYESSSTVRRRSIDVTVLHRANVPVNRHITFSWLVGGGFVYRPEQFISVTKEVLPDGQLTETNTDKGTSFRNYPAAAARLDVAFRVAPHLSVVPRLRVTAFPSLLDDSGLAPVPLLARPEIAVRWRF
jgi:hypothetical protein